jgi:hypothetical protein
MNLKDLREQLEKQIKEKEEKPWLIRNLLNFRDWVGRTDFEDEIVCFFQSLFRGYNHHDVYNVNSFIIKKIRPVFKKYVRYEEEHGMSLPFDFSSDPAGWLIVLKKIEFSIDHEWDEFQTDDYNPCEKMTTEEREEFNKKVQEGFELWGRYFTNLWD